MDRPDDAIERMRAWAIGAKIWYGTHEDCKAILAYLDAQERPAVTPNHYYSMELAMEMASKKFAFLDDR